ncbi:MAG: carbamoyltransferase HypF [Verrucomicrobia bacterium]|nr:carbamoyltransferase HypF [Verrucomicrobiota bacterium]
MRIIGGPAAPLLAGNPFAADLAPCPQCRRELADPRDRRHGHAFVTCARCGPRFATLHAFPGRREQTTMAAFALCPDCQRDCADAAGRRHQAAALACPRCGPRIVLTDPEGAVLAERESAIYVASRLLGDGRIVAVKGLAGYQLFADATCVHAVGTLRRRLHRDGEPLAVMFRDLAALRPCAELTPPAARQLQSPAAPIVIVPRRNGSALAPDVAPGHPWVGAVLPPSPLHVLLCQAVGRPLVVTGARLASAPPAVTATEAHARLLGIADAFLEDDLALAHPMSASIVRLTARGPLVLRRARGLAPAEFALPAPLAGRWLCAGGQRNSTLAIAEGDRIMLGPHLGDLGSDRALDNYQRTLVTLQSWRGGKLTGIACDNDPDSAAGRFARTLQVPRLAIQHHLAHALSCLLENRRGADDVLAVVWDGGGRGHDDTVWGGEFIRFTKGTARRFARLRRFRLPGGPASWREPRRALLGLLHAMGDAHFGPFAHEFGLAASDASVLHAALACGSDAPLTSSCGRLFDAVGALLQLRDRNAYDDQTALATEAIATGGRGAHLVLPFPARDAHDGAVCELDWGPMIEAMVTHRALSRDAASLSAAFHRALAHGIVEIARRAGCAAVALSGGCFQNVLLLDLTVAALQAAGFEVLVHHEIPPNDGGLAAGQALGALWGLSTVEPA